MWIMAKNTTTKIQTQGRRWSWFWTPLVCLVSGDGSSKEGSLLASQMINYLCCGVVCSVLEIAQILHLFIRGCHMVHLGHP